MGDVCRDVTTRLAVALQPNQDRFPNACGCSKGLRDLRQAKAEAVTVTSIRTCAVREALPPSAKAQAHINSQVCEGSNLVASPLLSTFAAMEPGEIPLVPDHELVEDDGVFFEAGSGPTTELN